MIAKVDRRMGKNGLMKGLIDSRTKNEEKLNENEERRHNK